MILGDETLLVVLVTFAIGVAVGRLWAGLTQRRAAGSLGRSRSIHYILGLDLLASRKLDRAAEELTKAAQENPEATDIYLVLGNLLREKGQIERAIQIHQSVLHRPGLTRGAKAHALLCLGMDFKRAGLRQRAMETLDEVVTIEPDNPYALATLEKIYEEEQDWEKALRAQEGISKLSGVSDATVEAFLHYQIGKVAWRDGELASASRAFEASLRANASIPPALIDYGDLLESQARLTDAESSWSELRKSEPHLAHLVFDRLARVWDRLGTPEKTAAMYEEIVRADEGDWRARLALARLRSAEGRNEDAFTLLLEAAKANPHAFPAQLAVVDFILDERKQDGERNPTERLGRYRDEVARAAFFLDPYVCVKCNYRTNGILWRCPHCQEWNTFVEERLETAEH